MDAYEGDDLIFMFRSDTDSFLLKHKIQSITSFLRIKWYEDGSEIPVI